MGDAVVVIVLIAILAVLIGVAIWIKLRVRSAKRQAILDQPYEEVMRKPQAD
jgi:hypothetical protein